MQDRGRFGPFGSDVAADCGDIASGAGSYGLGRADLFRRVGRAFRNEDCGKRVGADRAADR